MQPIIVFLDLTKVADFCQKSADAIRTQGLCHVIYIFFGSFLDKA